MASPTVSICIPVYNAGQQLRRCIDSVLAQAVDADVEVEVVVVDDASTDDSLAIMREYADLVRIERNEHNLGLTGNWQKALSMGRGEVVALLHMDDWYDPCCVQTALDAFRADPDLALLAMAQVHHYGEKTVRYPFPEEELGDFSGREYFQRRMRLRYCPAPSMVFLRRNALEGVSPLFDGEYRYCSELDLYVRMALGNPEKTFRHDRRELVHRGGSEAQFSSRYPGFRILDFCRTHARYLDRVEDPSVRADCVQSAAEMMAGDLIALVRLGDGEQLRQVGAEPVFRKWIAEHPEAVAGIASELGSRALGKLARAVGLDLDQTRPVARAKNIARRVALAASVFRHRSDEPFATSGGIANYVETGAFYPLKEYIDFRSDYRIRDGGEFWWVEFEEIEVAYPKTWSHDLVDRNFNAILNEQTHRRGNRSPHQYLRTEQLKSNWVVYDLGAAEGLQAKLWAPHVEHLVVLEPEPALNAALHATFADEIAAGKVDVLDVGVSDGPRVDQWGSLRVKLDSLPRIIAEHDLPLPTFVKADIEGQEMRFLRGAEELFASGAVECIQITTYHRPDDYLEIPEFLSRFPGRGEFNEGVVVFNRVGTTPVGYLNPAHPVFRKVLYTYRFD